MTDAGKSKRARATSPAVVITAAAPAPAPTSSSSSRLSSSAFINISLPLSSPCILPCTYESEKTCNSSAPPREAFSTHPSDSASTVPCVPSSQPPPLVPSLNCNHYHLEEKGPLNTTDSDEDDISIAAAVELTEQQLYDSQVPTSISAPSSFAPSVLMQPTETFGLSPAVCLRAHLDLFFFC